MKCYVIALIFLYRFNDWINNVIVYNFLCFERNVISRDLILIHLSICQMATIVSDMRNYVGVVPLTLSQWSSSGNPVAIQCVWNLDPSVHWNATGELPVCFQWLSSGFPVVFQCVPIMQINTGSPLEHHWVQASASVVPVAFQCTCGSSGLPVCSNYAN